MMWNCAHKPRPHAEAGPTAFEENSNLSLGPPAVISVLRQDVQIPFFKQTRVQIHFFKRLTTLPLA